MITFVNYKNILDLKPLELIDLFNLSYDSKLLDKTNPKLFIVTLNKILFSSLYAFSKDIAHNYKVSIFQKTTLSMSAISLKVFRTAFYDGQNLQALDEALNTQLRAAFFGGATELYKPFGQHLFHYDVNSLYPFCMLKDLPTLNPIKISVHDINLNTFFGYLKVTVTAPSSLKVPFLIMYHDEQLLQPLGTWTAWYFSEEIKFASSLGYSFTILEAIKFDKTNSVFSSFISHFYSKKIDSSTSSRFIAKLILNSLYGRLGQKVYKDHLALKFNPSLIYPISSYDKISLDTYDNISLDAYENLSLDTIDTSVQKSSHSSYKLKLVKNKHSFQLPTASHTNVAVSAAISAYARIHMYPFKVLKDNPCYYTDTDSLFLQYPLDPKFVSNKIGHFKLVHSNITVIFLSKKRYIIQKLDGDLEFTLSGYPLDKIHLLSTKSFKYFKELLDIRRVVVVPNKATSSIDSSNTLSLKITSRFILTNSDFVIKDTLPLFIK